MALTREFADDSVKNTQWRAFARKSDAADIGDLPTVVDCVALFLGELLAGNSAFSRRWSPGGPWA
jgi:hypothetical protein